MTATAPVAALLDLGFTKTEARVFCELTRLGPSTGYRLAKAVGKATANTYAALETLAQKGAVLIDEGESRAWRAVPAAELIAALEVMPETSGIALGFDRLVMLATHTDRIHDVLWVPVVG